MLTHILIKPDHKEPLREVDRIKFSPDGLEGNLTCNPFRQVLILPTKVLHDFNLQPGDLRENLIIEHDELHDLPSGTALLLGTARLRLTFHCEPCKRIKDKVAICDIQHQRGYFGQFLNYGTLFQNDLVINLGVVFEPIPYKLSDRLPWFLYQQERPVTITEILYGCGLGSYYARAIPNMVKRLPPALREKVVLRKQAA